MASIISTEVGHLSVLAFTQRLRGWSPWGCDFSGMKPQVKYYMAMDNFLRNVHCFYKILMGCFGPISG